MIPPRSRSRSSHTEAVVGACCLVSGAPQTHLRCVANRLIKPPPGYRMSDRFYTSTALAAGEFILSGAEAHHLATVRRFAPGDRVVLFNGDGHDYPADIISVGKRTVALNVLAPVAVDRELPFPLVVGSALPKGDRADFLVEKLTELGVTRFVPLVTAR